MYRSFYKLNADPFCLSPDHRFCYRHRSFAKARAYMHFALQRAEGFVMITGAPGTGKTTLLNQLVSEAHGARFTIARLNTTQLGADDLLQMAAYAFRQNREGHTKAQLLHMMEGFLQQQHRAGRRAVLIVDEAQDLSFGALEEVRLLTNLEMEGRPLLQVFLVGQEQLQDRLSTPELAQLQQRMIAHAHLEPMNADESAAYIAHRLRVSGWSDDPQISDEAIAEIFVFSHGVPRRVNQICSRLFLYGMVEEKHQLDLDDVQYVIGELHEERLLPSDDEELFADRIDPVRNAHHAAIRAEHTPQIQPHAAFIDTMHASPRRDGPFRDSSGGEIVTTSNRPTAHRTEVAQIAAKMMPGATSGNLAGAAGLAVAHKLEELPAKPDDTPATQRAAQIHELRPSRPPIASIVSAAPVPEPEYSAPLPVMHADVDALTTTRYQLQTRREWGLALLLSAFMLAAVLYAVHLDMAAPPPPHATGVQHTDDSTAVPQQADTTTHQSALPQIEPQTGTQQLEEQLQLQGLVIEPSGDGFVIDPGDDATFTFRSVVINAALRGVLDRIVAAVRDSQSTRIRVIGHADASGPPEVNLDISQDRADQVVKYLAHRGIPSHRLQTQARGAEQLKSTRDEFQNRRVEILIGPGNRNPE